MKGNIKPVRVVPLKMIYSLNLKFNIKYMYFTSSYYNKHNTTKQNKTIAGKIRLLVVDIQDELFHCQKLEVFFKDIDLKG